MVAVIGMGYIGFPTALMLASHGTQVVGVDINQERIETLKAGNLTFRESGLADLFRAAQKNGVRFSCEYPRAEVYLVSVPTPYDKFSKKVDPRYIIAAVREILNVCPAGGALVIESTISPGTIDRFIRPLIEENGFRIGKDIHLAHAPERIIPGNMIYELVHNSRVIGADDPQTGEKIKALYASFCQGKISVTDIRTAEMTKVVENTFRAVNIAFANELSKLCRHAGLDAHEVIRICNTHPRVNILNPGPGVGGHCISVDPWFLVGDYPSLTPIISASMRTNDEMPDYTLNRIYDIMRDRGLTDISRVGLYGLTYKANVDDTRESPTLQLLESQRRHLGEPLKTYDPMISRDIVENQFHSLDKFLDAVDFVVVMAAHDEIVRNASRLSDKIVLDCHHALSLPDAYYL